MYLYGAFPPSAAALIVTDVLAAAEAVLKYDLLISSGAGSNKLQPFASVVELNCDGLLAFISLNVILSSFQEYQTTLLPFKIGLQSDTDALAV